MDSANIIEIGLDRGPCFGTCPVFRFTASRHSGYSYEGGSYAQPVGSRSGRFPGHLFDRLAEVCVELRVLELDDLYPSHFEDVPLVIVTVRHKTGEKVFRDEGHRPVPVRLWAFAELIEVVMREAFYIEDRQTRSRRGRHPDLNSTDDEA